MRLRTVLLTLALVSATMTIIPAQSAGDPAPAAPECNSGYWYVRDGYQQFFPAHQVGTSYGFNCLLRWGDDNWGTVALQLMLIKCYGQNIPLDGIFRGQTYEALRNAQRIHGINDDGIYGWVTHTTVFWPTYPRGASIDDKYVCLDNF